MMVVVVRLVVRLVVRGGGGLGLERRWWEDGGGLWIRLGAWKRNNVVSAALLQALITITSIHGLSKETSRIDPHDWTVSIPAPVLPFLQIQTNFQEHTRSTIQAF